MNSLDGIIQLKNGKTAFWKHDDSSWTSDDEKLTNELNARFNVNELSVGDGLWDAVVVSRAARAYNAEVRQMPVDLTVYPEDAEF